MDIQLTDDQVQALRDALDDVLDDLSSEIAGTDNPSYRAILNTRREHLRGARVALGD